MVDHPGHYNLYVYDAQNSQKGDQLTQIMTTGSVEIGADDLAVIFEPHDLDSSFADAEVQAIIL